MCLDSASIVGARRTCRWTISFRVREGVRKPATTQSRRASRATLQGGEKGIYEWFELDRRNEVPRIVEGKYLKELYALHERKGTLDTDRKGLERLCKDCRPGYLCKETKLTVYCLESVF